MSREETFAYIRDFVDPENNLKYTETNVAAMYQDLNAVFISEDGTGLAISEADLEAYVDAITPGEVRWPGIKAFANKLPRLHRINSFLCPACAWQLYFQYGPHAVEPITDGELASAAEDERERAFCVSCMESLHL